MRRFKNILAVYSDAIGADDVFVQSVALAKANGAALSLMDVVPDRYATPAGVREREKRLQRLLPAVKAEGVDNADVVVLPGIPFLEIIQQVQRAEHDLVVTCPERSSTLERFYMGSTTTHLVRKCPSPVWVVKPNRDGHYKNVLACVDPNSGGLADVRLDRKIVELANSLTDANSAQLHILHAWDVEGSDRDRLVSEITDKVRSEILAKHESIHRDSVEIVLDETPNLSPNYSLHLMRSAPHEAIIKAADQLSIDLIVMGSVNKTGISGFFIGSAAEAVLSTARCSLFAVKPEDFRTPVVLERTPTRATG